jgi:RimJ/RimL family protein N-acetyltransferase
MIHSTYVSMPGSGKFHLYREADYFGDQVRVVRVDSCTDFGTGQGPGANCAGPAMLYACSEPLRDLEPSSRWGNAVAAPSTLVSKMKILRDVSDTDLPIFFEHQCEPEAHRMAGVHPREREAFMRHWRAKVLVNSNGLKKTIVVGDSVVGNILSWSEGSERFVGYWIGREYWGRGIATEALFEFLREELMRPMNAYVVLHNHASMRVLEKCGFIRVGEIQAGSDGIAEQLFQLEKWAIAANL